MARKKGTTSGLAAARLRKKVGCSGIGKNCGEHFVFTYNEHEGDDVEYYGRCKHCSATVKLKDRSLAQFINVFGTPELVKLKSTFNEFFVVEEDKEKDAKE